MCGYNFVVFNEDVEGWENKDKTKEKGIFNEFIKECDTDANKIREQEHEDKCNK